MGRQEKLNATWSRLNSMAEIQLFYSGGTLLSLQLLLVNFVILLIFQTESRKLSAHYLLKTNIKNPHLLRSTKYMLIT